MKNWMFVMALAFCGSAFGQEPVITDPSVETLPSARCAELTQQILAKQASIAYLEIRITANRAAELAAQNNFAVAMQNTIDHPVWFTMYYSQATYYLAQMIYYAGQVADDKWMRDAKKTELDALSLEHTLLDC